MKTIIMIVIFFTTLSFGQGIPTPSTTMPLYVALDLEEDPYPIIKNVIYKVNNTKSMEFIRLKWDVVIKGASNTHKMALEIVLYDKNKKMITKFKELITIKKNELQVFSGEKLLLTEMAQRLNKIGANLAVLTKKY